MLSPNSASDTKNAPVKNVTVWDIPTRLFHWSLVALVLILWISGTQGNLALHMSAGYALITLIVFRLIWGMIGSRSARFADFVRGPRAGLQYLSQSVRGQTPLYLGHNPLGGWMVLALLALLLVQAGLGLFSEDNLGIDNGPLAHLVSGATVSWATFVHKNVTLIVLLVLIAVHVCAVLFYLLVKRDNLIGAMLTGRKKIAVTENPVPVRFVSPLRAVIALAVAAGIVWGLGQVL